MPARKLFEMDKKDSTASFTCKDYLLRDDSQPSPK